MVVGIDPGTSGGRVVLVDGQQLVEVHPIPLKKIGKYTSIDLDALTRILVKLSKVTPYFVMEDVRAIGGGQISKGATFTFGVSVGTIKTLIPFATGIKPIMLKPMQWQKEVWDQTDIVYKENKRINTKETSTAAAKRIFGDIIFKKSERASQDDHNVIDAALIAYAYQNILKDDNKRRKIDSLDEERDGTGNRKRKPVKRRHGKNLVANSGSVGNTGRTVGVPPKEKRNRSTGLR